jgi:hypothetical protein
MPYNPVDVYWRFGGSYYLHHQGRGVKQATKHNFPTNNNTLDKFFVQGERFQPKSSPQILDGLILNGKRPESLIRQGRRRRF